MPPLPLWIPFHSSKVQCAWTQNIKILLWGFPLWRCRWLNELMHVRHLELCLSNWGKLLQRGWFLNRAFKRNKASKWFVLGKLKLKALDLRKGGISARDISWEGITLGVSALWVGPITEGLGNHFPSHQVCDQHNLPFLHLLMLLETESHLTKTLAIKISNWRGKNEYISHL